MERRRELRQQFAGTATVKILGNGSGSAASVKAEILDLSGSGMCVRVPRPIPCGMPIEIDCGDSMALGEICRCEPENGSPDGPFLAGVQVSEVVASLSELQRFSQRLEEFAAGSVYR